MLLSRCPRSFCNLVQPVNHGPGVFRPQICNKKGPRGEIILGSLTIFSPLKYIYWTEHMQQASVFQIRIQPGCILINVDMQIYNKQGPQGEIILGSLTIFSSLKYIYCNKHWFFTSGWTDPYKFLSSFIGSGSITLSYPVQWFGFTDFESTNIFGYIYTAVVVY